eukprot:scaffold4047_cov97-Skeletonema_dohrnii-CCMP3373.AAC.5
MAETSDRPGVSKAHETQVDMWLRHRLHKIFESLVHAQNNVLTRVSKAKHTRKRLQHQVGPTYPSEHANSMAADGT